MTTDDEMVRRSVSVGGLTPMQLLTELERNGVHLNETAMTFLNSPLFHCTEVRRALATVELSVRQLGLRDGGCWPELQDRAAAMGLCPPPAELAPHFRLQYLDQAEGHLGFPLTKNRAPPGSITVASLPLSNDWDFPRGLYLRRIEGHLWLRGYIASNDHFWEPCDRLVFCAT